MLDDTTMNTFAAPFPTPPPPARPLFVRVLRRPSSRPMGFNGSQWVHGTYRPLCGPWDPRVPLSSNEAHGGHGPNATDRLLRSLLDLIPEVSSGFALGKGRARLFLQCWTIWTFSSTRRYTYTDAEIVLNAKACLG